MTFLIQALSKQNRILAAVAPDKGLITLPKTRGAGLSLLQCEEQRYQDRHCDKREHDATISMQPAAVIAFIDIGSKARDCGYPYGILEYRDYDGKERKENLRP